VGAAAKLTIKDATNGRPVFRPHRPWDGWLAVPVPPPVRENEEAAVTGWLTALRADDTHHRGCWDMLAAPEDFAYGI
jgi:hypothetical protein